MESRAPSLLLRPPLRHHLPHLLSKLQTEQKEWLSATQSGMVCLVTLGK